MKRALVLAAVLMITPHPAFARKISMLPPDAQTRPVVEKIFMDFGIGSESPVRARAAWLEIEDGKPPYLFVRSASNCPDGGCEIFGFRQNDWGEWKQVYAQFGDKGLEVLDSQTDGHHDLLHWEKTEDGYNKKLSRWKGEAYGMPEIEVKSYMNFTKMRPGQCTWRNPTGIALPKTAPMPSDIPPWEKPTDYKDYGLGKSDAKALEVLKILDLNPGDVQSNWIPVADNVEALFLFEVSKCGAANCTIDGYIPNQDGQWMRIYSQFGGDELRVLKTKTGGYYDIMQFEGRGAGEMLQKTSRWTGKNYGEPVTTPVP